MTKYPPFNYNKKHLNPPQKKTNLPLIPLYSYRGDQGGNPFNLKGIFRKIFLFPEGAIFEKVLQVEKVPNLIPPI